MAGLPKERMEMLTVEAEATDKRIAELEDDLSSARERLAILENQNHSLQTSLNLIINENLRLLRCLTEREAAVDKARAQIEQIKAVLGAAEAERKMLAAAINARNERPELLQNWVVAKKRRIQPIEQLCSKPIEDPTQILLAGTITF